MGTVDKTESFTMHLAFKAITLAFAAYMLSNGNDLCSGCEIKPLGSKGCRRQEERGPTDDIQNQIQIWEVCDSNDDNELTWLEVMECEEKYCALVSFDCPSENDFNDF